MAIREKWTPRNPADMASKVAADMIKEVETAERRAEVYERIKNMPMVDEKEEEAAELARLVAEQIEREKSWKRPTDKQLAHLDWQFRQMV